MSPFSLAGAVRVRRVLAAGLLALVASAAHSCELTQENPGVRISGQLTLKSSEPGTWWAVTDDEGRIWKIASPPPDLVLIFENIQNQRINVEGCQLEKELNFEQIEPYLITSGVMAPESAPASEPVPELAPVPEPASAPEPVPVPVSKLASEAAPAPTPEATPTPEPVAPVPAPEPMPQPTPTL